MRLPTVEGLIRRRILANFSADPEVVARLVPAPLKPKKVGKSAVVGICLIRLEQIRPLHFPAALGFNSENAAHRIAVSWTDSEGKEREGVYIPRRDTSSTLSHLAGGRLFPGEHHLAEFTVLDRDAQISLTMRSSDGAGSLSVRASETDRFESKLFSSLDSASEFFRGGSLGYSARKEGGHLDGITLRSDAWKVTPLKIEEIHSSFFEDQARFPPGSIAFDCALLMRDIPHQWHSEPDLPITYLEPTSSAVTAV